MPNGYRRVPLHCGRERVRRDKHLTLPVELDGVIDVLDDGPQAVLTDRVVAIHSSDDEAHDSTIIFKHFLAPLTGIGRWHWPSLQGGSMVTEEGSSNGGRDDRH